MMNTCDSSKDDEENLRLCIDAKYSYQIFQPKVKTLNPKLEEESNNHPMIRVNNTFFLAFLPRLSLCDAMG